MSAPPTSRAKAQSIRVEEEDREEEEKEEEKPKKKAAPEKKVGGLICLMLLVKFNRNVTKHKKMCPVDIGHEADIT